jgi:hypothetical protein
MKPQKHKGQLDKGQLELAAYILTIPPEEMWEEIKTLLPPKTAENIENLYLWGSKYFDNFLKSKPNPVPESGLQEEFQLFCEYKGTYWMLLSNLIFQAERYIKDEATERKLDYQWESWSDLAKRIIWEEFIYLLCTSIIETWESPNGKTIEQGTKKCIKFLNDELLPRASQTSTLDELRKKLTVEDLKQNHSQDMLNIHCTLMPWSVLVEEVCEKYKDRLSAFHPWVNHKYPTSLPRIQKHAFINGEFKTYPGRGKGKEWIKVNQSSLT